MLLQTTAVFSLCKPLTQPASRFGPCALGNPASAAWLLSLSCVRPGPGIFSHRHHFVRALLALAETVSEGTQIAMYIIILLCLKRHVSHVNDVEQSQRHIWKFVFDLCFVAAVIALI